MVYIVGITITVFLCLILISKRSKTQADLILFAWLLTIGLHLFLYYLQLTGIHFQYPFLLGCQFPLPFLQWTFLYLYISSLTSKKPLNYKFLVHFIPFLLSIILFYSYFILPNSDKIRIYKQLGKGFETQMTINLIGIIASGIIYITWSMIKLRRYKRLIKNEFSYTEKINLNWLRYLIFGMTAVFLVILLNFDNQYIFFSVVCFVIFIGVYGIKQVGVFSQNQALFNNSHENNHNFDLEQADSKLLLKTETLENSNFETYNKYQKSTLNDKSAIIILEDLHELMKTQQLYQNPELSIDDLAKVLGVLPNHLSQVINSMEDKNFYDYINHLRIENFISLVLKPESQKYTLLSLAFESGFNSKTSFNRNFKKVTGLTPTEYLRQNNIKTAE